MRQLGPPPVRAAGQDLVEVLAAAYAKLAERAEQPALD
jgi:hypothetical protein